MEGGKCAKKISNESFSGMSNPSNTVVGSKSGETPCNTTKKGVFRGGLRQKKDATLSPRGGARRVIFSAILHMMVVCTMIYHCAKFDIDRHRSSYSTRHFNLPPPNGSRFGPYVRLKPRPDRIFFRSAGRKNVHVCLFLTYIAPVERKNRHQSKRDQIKLTKGNYVRHFYSHF